MSMLAETTSFAICCNNNSGKASKRNDSTTTKIVGRSRAGDATAFAIPELKWLFDCGALVQQWKPRTIFLTHTHSDHVHFIFRFRDEDRPPTIYLPEASVPFVEACIKAYQGMTDCGCSADDDDYDYDDEVEETIERQRRPTKKVEYVLRATKPNEEIFFSEGGHKFAMRTLNMDHRIPCLGYSIFKLRSRLKEEYTGLPSREIGRLRKAGVEITTLEEEPYLCFMGDTTAKVFEDYPEILNQHSTVIVECSFIDEKSRERAETTKHMHWDDLQPLIASHPGTMFVLIHFSLKYSTLSLRRFFRDHQLIYDNIHPMLIEREVEEQWRNAGEEGPPPRCNCRVCRAAD
jgi:ribonuclease Z